MQIVILDTPEQVADYGADRFADQLKHKPDSVLGLATGSTPIALYNALIARVQRGELSFAKARTFNLDEYLGLAGTHLQSYRYFMNEHLFRHLDIDLANTAVPDGATEEPLAACDAYEAAIKAAGGIDLQLLGIGRNGHIGFNEPSSSLASRTRVKTLTPDTVKANQRFFEAGEFQPHLSITMGIGTIMEARQILLLASGAGDGGGAARGTVPGVYLADAPQSHAGARPGSGQSVGRCGVLSVHRAGKSAPARRLNSVIG